MPFLAGLRPRRTESFELRMPIRPLGPVVLLLTLTSCGVLSAGLSTEDKARLANFQANAQDYYGNQRYGQALEMVRKGLELDAENYMLLSLAGWCHLQRAERGGPTEELLTAEDYFERVERTRSLRDHAPHVLLGLATSKQRLGLENRRLADRLDNQVASGRLSKTEQTVQANQAAEHRQTAERCWRESIDLLEVLVEREDVLRIAHKLLMEVYVEIGDYEQAVHHGDLCLQRNLDEQEVKNAVIRETLVAAEEIKARKELQELEDQEIRVREALAEMHFRKDAFADAVAQLDAVLAKDPSESVHYYNRGRALQSLGRQDDARRDFEQFLRTTTLSSDDERVARAFEVVRGPRR
jgi:tetratricopeptide (TPR) repeat protein